MKKELIETKYREVTNDLKSEKMDWDFESFLEKTDQIDEKPSFGIKKKTKNRKIFWLAASIVILLTVAIAQKYYQGFEVHDQDVLVKKNIQNEKNNFLKENEPNAIVAIDSTKTTLDSTIHDSVNVAEPMSETALMDQILPKRGRIKKDGRPRFVDNSQTKEFPQSPDKQPVYKSNYVIINGQRIEDEQEAIAITKYSFQILSKNVSKTLAQAEVMTDYNTDH